MRDLLTAAGMRAVERAAIQSGAVTGAALMERAGQGVVAAVLETWPELAEGARSATVLCGPGNNGGDGFVVARLLRARGWQVSVFLYGDAAKLPPDARTNHQRWCELGEVRPLTGAALAARGVCDLSVDALFGTGLTRPLQGELAAALEGRPSQDWPRRVAVDVPSGLCADSGRLLADRDAAPAVRADLTVSFHSAKPGHVLSDGPELCGALVVKDIGLDAEGPGTETLRLTGRPEGLGKDAGHKFSHGHALVLTGGFGRTGAARLAARGALRIGAGLVTLGAPGAAQMEVACQITGLMLTRVEDADGLAQVLQDGRIGALCLGPGLGLDRARALVPVALASGQSDPSRPSVVLDADALTAYREDPDALFARLHAGCVLTPHDGEFARLFPDLAKRLREAPKSGPAFSRIDAARVAAGRAGCTVVLKGPDSVIADPEGRAVVNAAVYDRAAPWLATAGSGDVLAGFVTGLLARGMAPMPAAEAATWLHVESALRIGPGLIAEDLPEALPQVLRALQAAG
ncbi:MULTISPECIES: NAD(P)H-hydrate dehydratase [Roseobacteraceae]|uniref:NAD(P)H-hydrate dehydratase n=1 Tax=Roseobacteraceae TaxID=2854170 RepID=UPI002B272EE9|nr:MULTISPECIES: NAD(P)H-hydrate dehydratase [Roseobacteraceae]